jgi:putative ABC transport system permease protein
VIALWLSGLLTRRSGRLLGTAVGVALAVALLAGLGAFLAASSASMTSQAVASLPVDWQIQLAAGADAGAISAAARAAAPSRALQTVGYADAAGFVAQTGGTVQTTGAGKVVGLDPSYRLDFPAQFGSLIGSLDGVLVAQQTAANLHVAVGDKVTIERVGLPPADVAVEGIVDLPNADAMFQAVGTLPGLAPQAPPDNVLLLPMADWHRLFDGQAEARPDSVRMQIHLGLIHERLASDPDTAYGQVLGAGRNLEARIAGGAILADNLAARLDAVRGDALYAKVLFLFLGAPGAILAGLLALAVAASGSQRRRREQALLRVRGASTIQILGLAGAEAAAVGILGVAAGLAAGTLASAFLFGIHVLGRATCLWLVGAGIAGLALTAGAVFAPAWREVRQMTVARARAPIGGNRRPVWQRLYLDLFLLALSAAIFWETAGSAYQIVLAPEGVAASSVDYHAFLAPTLLWIGMALLTVRLLAFGFDRSRALLGHALRSVAGRLSGIVVASLSRQRSRVTRGVVLVAVAMSFAVSTAVFDMTYRAQTRIDAELTNGADVSVTGTSTAPAGSLLAKLAALPGVTGAQALQHRFAYVGTDLQDIYGIDALRIGEATPMSNAYFRGGDARAALALLAGTPDGVLVSEETVRDFQLQPGDRINLRLLNLADRQYHKIPFRFVGVVREFPTAPRDSFLVANAAYVGQQTGSFAGEVVLLRASGDPARLATAVRGLVGSLPGVKVGDVGSSLRLIASSLTAIDVRGLTGLELGFAVLLVVAAAGIVFALNLADRRRSFAILAVLGAKRRQLAAFLWSEGLLILIGGAAIGLSTGFAVAEMLVTLLTAVFDPPPQQLAVPWPYLALTGLAMLASIVGALLATQAMAQTSAVEQLREG